MKQTIQRLYIKKDNNLHVLAIVLIPLISSFVGYIMYAHQAHLANASTGMPATSVYIAPTGKCSDTHSGQVVSKPVCTLGRAQYVISKLQAKSQAQGDIYVRLVDGTYSTDSLGYKINAVANTGYTFYIVPADYSSDTLSTYRPTLTCNNAKKTGRNFVLSIGKKSDGAVKLSQLHIENCTNGLDIGGQLSFGCPTKGLIAKTPIIGSIGQPMKGITLNRIQFKNIGNKYFSVNKTYSDAGWAAINLHNATNVTMTNISFKNLENVGAGKALIHGLYAKQSTNIQVTRSTFTDISGDPIRLRHKNRNITIKGNYFIRSGDKSAISEWYHDPARAVYYKSCVEASGDKPLNMLNNFFSDKGYDGQSIKRWFKFS